MQLNAVIPKQLAGKRLDQALVILFPKYSRTQLQLWIRHGKVHINSRIMRPRDQVSGGERVAIETNLRPHLKDSAEAIPLSIVYEDEALLIINKPAGLVVHPGAGQPEHTLLNALLHHDATLEQVPRAGIIHRLDKNTTGLMVIARTLASYNLLVRQLQARKIHRQYRTLVSGMMTAGGCVDKAIGRHPKYRTKMAVVDYGKSAVTHYRIIEKYRYHTYLKVSLETGRTHQIRVHLAWLRHPIVGDPVYGAGRQFVQGMHAGIRSLVTNFPRPALHASNIELYHPLSKKQVKWQISIPEDMQQLLESLQVDGVAAEAAS